MYIAVTGHRSEDCESELEVRRKFRLVFEECQPELVIVGMANGCDLWAGDEARLMGIEIWAVRPWAGHEPRVEDEELYSRLIDYASKVVVVTDQEEYPGPYVYHKRNEWMVDNSTHVLAYLSPSKTRGGTFSCVKYAEGKKPIRNIYG